jgi:hypothetical protein
MRMVKNNAEFRRVPRLGAWRAVRITVIAAFLLLLVWLGIGEGIDGLREAEGRWQRIAAATQICYGVASVACLLALFVRPALAATAFTVWALALTATAGLAPVVWGGAPWQTGVLAAGATFAIAALVTWGAFAHLRWQARTQGGPVVPRTAGNRS